MNERQSAVGPRRIGRVSDEDVSVERLEKRNRRTVRRRQRSGMRSVSPNGNSMRGRGSCRTWVAAGCLAVSLLAGCDGAGGPTADETAPTATAPATESAAALPAGFPADVPVYPGARPTGSLAATRTGMVVTFQSTDAPDKVFAFYRTQLVERGWSISGEASFLGQGALSGTKDNRTASAVIVGATGSTQIIVTTATMD